MWAERGQPLYSWCKDHDKYDIDFYKYDIDFSSQWLEACCMDFDIFVSDNVSDSEKHLDLLAPIRLK